MEVFTITKIKKRFVGLFDILGFTNLVLNNTLEWLVEHFNTIFVDAISEATQPTAILNGKEHKIILSRHVRFSDTILLYTDDDSKMSLVNIIECSNLFLYKSLVKGFPLRGAITHGEFYIGKDGDAESFLGKPLVEAYLLEKKQVWSGAIVDPKITTNIEYEDVTEKMKTWNRLINYEVPLKDDLLRPFYCVEWPGYFYGGFGGLEPPIRDLMTGNYTGTTSNDIEEKINNTVKFAEHCKIADSLPDEAMWVSRS